MTMTATMTTTTTTTTTAIPGRRMSAGFTHAASRAEIAPCPHLHNPLSAYCHAKIHAHCVSGVVHYARQTILVQQIDRRQIRGVMWEIAVPIRWSGASERREIISRVVKSLRGKYEGRERGGALLLCSIYKIRAFFLSLDLPENKNDTENVEWDVMPTWDGFSDNSQMILRLTRSSWQWIHNRCNSFRVWT